MIRICPAKLSFFAARECTRNANTIIINFGNYALDKRNEDAMIWAWFGKKLKKTSCGCILRAKKLTHYCQYAYLYWEGGWVC
jgi:hypothetical protein